MAAPTSPATLTLDFSCQALTNPSLPAHQVPSRTRTATKPMKTAGLRLRLSQARPAQCPYVSNQTPFHLSLHCLSLAR